MAALLRAPPRLGGPAVAWGRPLCALWCLGRRPPTSAAKQPGLESEKFQMVYRFDSIRVFGFVSRMKLAQTALTVVAVPPAFYWYSQGLLTHTSMCMACGVAGFALSMLYWMSYFFRRLVGILYVNESGTILQVAHLTFWGWRQDTYCPVVDVVPLTETQDRPQDLFIRIRQYSGKQTFYLTLRYGRVLDRERFSQVFGTLATLK
ncbi:transmembrane protein 186 [Perognathus longimembris pacificus]|uniref:transmembrane protein 186 n=1 Tax=Perognathus longimembris pacificus TaxID=214514 RepID=UPI002018F575|nr:transmembrane protein 186 [Perognathus longimembris pacificus]